LSAGLKWASEPIEAHSLYYHALAWTAPAIQTAVVLGVGAIDGDGVSGMCSVGNTRVEFMRALVLGERGVY
jgi:hypothetical protein